jgi:hypothetical protein
MTILENKVINNEPIGASYYCEMALRVNALKGELDNKIACLEAQMMNIEAELVGQDMPSSKAKTLARSQIDFKKLLELKAKEKRVEQFIMLAKKRATINEY